MSGTRIAIAPVGAVRVAGSRFAAAAIRRGRDLEATCVGARGAIPFTLDEPRQGALAVTLRLGGGTVHCASFGGRIARDAPARGGKGGVFSASDAPPTACPGGSPTHER